MGELIKTNNLPATSPSRLLEILRDGFLVGNLSDEDLFTIVRNSITKSFIDAGFMSPAGPDMSVLCSDVTFDIKEKYPSLRDKEIKTIFENGVMGLYGEYMGLSRRTFNQFLKAYYMSEQRQKAVREHLERMDGDKIEPTEQEKENICIENALRAWEVFKKDGQFADIGNVVYNFIDRRGLIKFDASTKNKFMVRAEAIVKANQHLKAVTGDLFVIQATRKALAEIEAGQGIELIKAEAKRIALNEFFNHLKESRGELKHLLQ